MQGLPNDQFMIQNAIILEEASRSNRWPLLIDPQVSTHACKCTCAYANAYMHTRMHTYGQSRASIQSLPSSSKPPPSRPTNNLADRI